MGLICCLPHMKEDAAFQAAQRVIASKLPHK
jgi:hypothetical protein